MTRAELEREMAYWKRRAERAEKGNRNRNKTIARMTERLDKPKGR